MEKQKQSSEPQPSLHEAIAAAIGAYMNAKDLYAYFGKRVSYDKCLELLHSGHIRSAWIGGKLLTKQEYVQEYERTIFCPNDAPTLMSSLTVTHTGILEKVKAAASDHRPLKKR